MKDIEKLVRASLKLMKKKGVVLPKNLGYNEEPYDEPPAFYPGHRELVMEKRRICVHADGSFPWWMFAKEYPGEVQAELDHRKNIWRPITSAGWMKAAAKLATIWNEANYSVKFDDPEQAEYFTSTYPIDGNVFNYFSGYELKYRLKDANALKIIWFVTTELPDNEKLQPIVKIIPVEKVVYRNRDVAIILWKDDELKTFLVIDSVNYYWVKQLDKTDKPKFETTPIFAQGHGMEETPWQTLGGDLVEIEGVEYYRSVFYPVIPDLDNACLDGSMLRIVKDRFGYPIKVVFEDPCDEPNCENGKIVVEVKDGTPIYRECQKCKARHANSGVQRTHYVKTNRFNDDRVVPPSPVQFVEQAYQAPTILREEIEAQIENAWLALNIQITLRPEGKTATEVLADHEEQYAFFKTFSDISHRSAEWSVGLMGRFRFQDQWKPPTWTRPVSFATRSAAEMSEEVGKAIDSGLPITSRAAIIRQYEHQRFSLNADQKKALETIQFSDDLYYATDTEVARLVAAGTMEPWRDYLHSSANQLMQELMLETPDLLNMELIPRRDLLWALAKTRVTTETRTDVLT